MFNSMVNSRITDYMEKFGICGWIASNRYTYQESSPFTNLMLNLKYLIAPYGAYLDKTHNEQIASSGNAVLMQNRYYVPMGFMVNSDLLNYNVDTAAANDPIKNQNEFFRLATGLDGNLYNLIKPVSYDAPDNGALSESSFGSYSYSAETDSGNYRINYTAPRDGVAVAYFDNYYVENVSLQVNNNTVIEYYIKRPFIMMIGDVKAGDKISCSANVSGSTSGTFTSYVAMVDEDLFKQAYDRFSASALSANKVTDTSISGSITAQEDGLFYTSVPYVEGWRAYVDGKEVEITPVGKAMLAFKLDKGLHFVELRYTPEGFVPGLIISILGVLIFAALIILTKKKAGASAQLKQTKKHRKENTLGDGSASDEDRSPYADENNFYRQLSDTDSDHDDNYYDNLSDDEDDFYERYDNEGEDEIGFVDFDDMSDDD